MRFFRRDPGQEDEFQRLRAKLLAEAPIPCLWLFGKTGSGKTSIIHELTGAAEAVIGGGFRPQTRHSRLFSFPDEELPIVRFLDTGGLGEADYDPAGDLAEFNKSTQLVIVTVCATDQATEEVIRPLRSIRKAGGKRPSCWRSPACMMRIRGSSIRGRTRSIQANGPSRHRFPKICGVASRPIMSVSMVCSTVPYQLISRSPTMDSRSPISAESG